MFQAKKLVARLSEDIEGLQKKVEEKKRNVESKEITEEEQSKFQQRRQRLLFEEGEEERVAMMSSNKRSFLKMKSNDEISRSTHSCSPIPFSNEEEDKKTGRKLKRKGTFAKLLSATHIPKSNKG